MEVIWRNVNVMSMLCGCNVEECGCYVEHFGCNVEQCGCYVEHCGGM